MSPYFAAVCSVSSGSKEFLLQQKLAFRMCNELPNSSSSTIKSKLLLLKVAYHDVPVEALRCRQRSESWSHYRRRVVQWCPGSVGTPEGTYVGMCTNTMSIRLLTPQITKKCSRGHFNCGLQLQTRIVDIDLSIPEGVLMAIVGPNGKSR
jgi:hypothetical protein